MQKNIIEFLKMPSYNNNYTILPPLKGNMIKYEAHYRSFKRWYIGTRRSC